MAARDRYGGVFADLGFTPLQRAIRTTHTTTPFFDTILIIYQAMLAISPTTSPILRSTLKSPT